MNRIAMMRKISRRAKRCGHDLSFVRQGRHEYWACGGFTFAVPRHREIPKGTVEGIFKDLEPVLGEGWWREEG